MLDDEGVALPVEIGEGNANRALCIAAQAT
jgi:hypothetical protein